MTNFNLRISPFETSNELEVFFDEGQIMLEMHDIVIEGSAQVRDPDT